MPESDGTQVSQTITTEELETTLIREDTKNGGTPINRDRLYAIAQGQIDAVCDITALMQRTKNQVQGRRYDKSLTVEERAYWERYDQTVERVLHAIKNDRIPHGWGASFLSGRE